jgi:hypothetical protein
MAELGNLTACILLRLWRKSTVKIRAGSLFHTPSTRIGPARAAFGCSRQGFPTPSTAHRLPSQDVHRQIRFAACAEPALGCKVKEENSFEDDWRKDK